MFLLLLTSPVHLHRCHLRRLASTPHRCTVPCMCDIYSNPLIAYDTLAVMYGWGWVRVGGGGRGWAGVGEGGWGWVRVGKGQSY